MQIQIAVIGFFAFDGIQNFLLTLLFAPTFKMIIKKRRKNDEIKVDIGEKMN